ncbi:hypothetical protein HN873_069975 [Arachis hypogaea]
MYRHCIGSSESTKLSCRLIPFVEYKNISNGKKRGSPNASLCEGREFRIRRDQKNGRICHIYWDHIVDVPEEVEVVDVVDDEPCPTTDTVEQSTPQETPGKRSKKAVYKKPTPKKLYVKKANKENKINQSCNETQNPASPNPSPTTQPTSHSEIPNINRNTTQQQSEAEVPPPNNSQQGQNENTGEPTSEVNVAQPPSNNSGSSVRVQPMVSSETMNAASPSLRERFQQFMPTPGLTRQPMSGPRPSLLAPSLSGPNASSPSAKCGPAAKNIPSAKVVKGGSGAKGVTSTQPIGGKKSASRTGTIAATQM